MQVSPQQCSPQTTRWRRYANEIRGIGVSEIVFGTICLSVNIAALVFSYYWFPYNDDYHYYYYHNPSSYSWVMAGIWGGIMVIITGSLGAAYPNRMTKSALNANLAMSILSTLASATIVAMETIAAICPVIEVYHDSFGYYYCYTNALLASLHGITAGFGFICFCHGISHSAYCCKISCGGNSTSHTQALMMQGINGQNQPMQGINGQIQPIYGINRQIQPIYGMNGQNQPIQGINGQIQPTYGMNGQIQPTYGMNGQIQPICENNGQIQPIQGINGQIQPIFENNGQIQPIQVYSGQNQPVLYQIPVPFNPYGIPPNQQNQPTTSALVSDGPAAYTNHLMQAEVNIPGLIQEPAPTTSATSDA